MKLYYKAITSDGKPIDGFIEAKDPGEVASYLRSKELLPIEIAEKEKGGASPQEDRRGREFHQTAVLNAYFGTYSLEKFGDSEESNWERKICGNYR